MKSSNFARLALLLPYIPLAESILYFVVWDISEKDSLLQSFNLLWNFLAIFWYVPYTLFVIYLLIWSIGKTTSQIFKRFKFAPVILMILSASLFSVSSGSLAWRRLGAWQHPDGFLDSGGRRGPSQPDRGVSICRFFPLVLQTSC